MDSRTGIDSLPNEIVYEIIGYLNQKSLKECCLVSQLFFDCSAPRLWQKIQFPVLNREHKWQEDDHRRRFLENLKIMSSYVGSAPSRQYAAFVKEIDLNYPVSLTAFKNQILPFLNQTLKKFTNLQRLSLAPLNAKTILKNGSIIAFGGKVVWVLKENLAMLKELEYLSFPCSDIQSLCVCLQENEGFLRAWLKVETIHLRQLFDRLDLIGPLVDKSRNIQEIDIGFEESTLSPEITTSLWSRIIRSRLLRRINVANISYQPDTAVKDYSTPSVASLSIIIYPHSKKVWHEWVFQSLSRLKDLKLIESDPKIFFSYGYDTSWLKPVLPRLRSLTYVGSKNPIRECIWMARNLEVLNLKEISRLDLSHLRKLRRLKELTIDRCWMSDECEMDFAQFLGSMTTLRELTVNGRHGQKFYQSLIENTTHVRVLLIDFDNYERSFALFIVFFAKYFRLHPHKSWPQITITIPAKCTWKKGRWYSLFPESAGIIHFRYSPFVNDYNAITIEDMLL